MSVFEKYSDLPVKKPSPVSPVAPIVSQVTQNPTATQSSTAMSLAQPQKAGGILGVLTGVKNAVTSGLSNIFSKYTSKPQTKEEIAKENAQKVLSSASQSSKIASPAMNTVPYEQTAAGMTEATLKGIPEAARTVLPAVGGVAADLVRYPARSAIKGALTIFNKYSDNPIDQINVEEDLGKLSKYLLGEEPITPLQQDYQEGASGLASSGYGKLAKPIALVGSTGAVALDLLPFGNLTKRGALKLAGTIGEQAAEKTARAEFPKLMGELEKYPSLLRDFIGKAAVEKDATKIESLLKNVEKEVKNLNEKNLIVQHNISQDKLIHANKKGGLPVPSIAISDKNNPIEGFGEISLIGDKNLIDPKIKSNKVYDADVYSPRYPSVNYSIDKNAGNFLNDLKLKAKNTESYFTGEDTKLSSYAYEDVLGDFENQGIGAIERRPVLKQVFAMENGLPTNSSKDDISNFVENNREKYQSFVEEIYTNLNPKERIFKGFTYSGNRIYRDATIENIVKDMKKTVRNGENFNYGAPSIRASVAKQFRSLDAITKDRKKIVSTEEMSKIKDAFNNEFYALLEKHNVTDTNVFVENLKDVLLGKETIQQFKEWTGISDQGVADFLGFSDRIKNAPTEYFEAKPQRAVDVGEFTAAVIPKNTTDKVKEILQSKGLHIVEYDPNIKGDRARAIADVNKIKNISFAATGGTAGIEQDDQGNITYNPTKGALGALGFGALGLMAKRGASTEEIIKEWDNVVRKELQKAENLPRSKRVYKLQSMLGESYRALGAKADEVFHYLTTEMELAQPGERIFIGEGADRRVIAGASTFPKWVPEELRSSELFGRVLEDMKAPDDFRFNEKLNAVRERRLMNAFYDQMDRELGVDTKPIREQIIRSISKDGRLEERDATIINRLIDAQDKYHQGLITKEEKNIELKKLIDLREKQAAQEIADKAKFAELLDSVKMRNIQANVFNEKLFPLKTLSQKARAIFTDFENTKYSAREIANATYERFKDIPNQDFKEIIEYQAGKETPWIREVFDDLYTEAKNRGVDTGYRTNYIPQVYAESKEKVDDAVSKFLKDKGLSDEQMRLYTEGKSVDDAVLKRLRLDPKFSIHRVFPDYETAIKYGLTPKFNSVAEHIAWYREQLENTVSDRLLVERLKEAGELTGFDLKGKNWQPVSLNFYGREQLYAPADVARVINNLYPSLEHQNTLYGKTMNVLGSSSAFMQDWALSSGIPFTTVNFFAASKFIKDLTTAIGEMATLKPRQALQSLKSASAFFRANSIGASEKYFAREMPTIAMMADRGIDVSRRIGGYDEVSRSISRVVSDLKSSLEKKDFMGYALLMKSMFGKGWDAAWNNKTFRVMIPMQMVETFKGAYNNALSRGLTTGEAADIAAGVVKNYEGIIDDFARSKATRDTLKAFFFAPHFRESMINFFVRSTKLFNPKNLLNPELAKNRDFFVGAAITFALYNLIQKKLTGTYTWENGSGNEMNLMIPLEKKQAERLTGESDETQRDRVVVTFLPSMMTIPRNIVGGITSLVTGDWETAGQKFGSFFSMPVKIATEIFSNSDYFGRPIYKDTDTAKTKVLKSLNYAVIGQGNPIVGESQKYLQGKESLLEAGVRIAELPIKMQKQDWIEQKKRYELLDRAKIMKTRQKESLQEVYDRLKQYNSDGDKEGFDKLVSELSTDEKTLIKEMQKSEKTATTNKKKNKYYPVFRKMLEAEMNNDNDTFNKLVQSVPKEDRHILKLLKNEYERVRNYQ